MPLRIAALGLVVLSMVFLACHDGSNGEDVGSPEPKATQTLYTPTPGVHLASPAAEVDAAYDTPVPLEPAPALTGPDIPIDYNTTWGNLVSMLAPDEQICVRQVNEGQLATFIDEPVLTESDLPDWAIPFFDCLEPETATSIFRSILIAGMMADESIVISADQVECVSEWAATADVHALVPALVGEEDEVALGELMAGVMPCLAPIFVYDWLAEIGIRAEDLTAGERDCFTAWIANFDWNAVITGMETEDLDFLSNLFPGMIECAPGAFLGLFVAEMGFEVDDFTQEEQVCLEEWFIDVDWGEILLIMPAGSGAYGEGTNVLAEALGLIECAPNLFLDDHGDSTLDATNIEVGETVSGDIAFIGDTDFFAVTLEPGTTYTFEVILGSLKDSVLSIHASDQTQLAYNDDAETGGLGSLITWTPVAGGTFYLQVQGYWESGSYTLSVGGP